MKIVSAATRRPVTVVVFFVALVIFGVISFRELPVDLLPDLSFPTLTIRTEYPGVAPADVETFVTTPIEDAVGIVSGLVDISSVSRAGLSDVIMEFAWGTDMDFAAIDVREQLAQLALPSAAEDPILLRFDPALDPIMRISVGSAVPGDVTVADQAGLRLLAEQSIKQRLESIDGVAAAIVAGGVEEEIQINVDQSRAALLRIPLSQIANRLQRENVDVTGGSIADGAAEYVVRVLARFADLDEIARIVVGEVGDVQVRLQDLADVRSGYQEQSTITRTNRQPSVEIAIHKEAAANTVAVAQAVQERLREVEQELEGVVDVELRVVSDQSRFIEQSIRDVIQAAVLGGVLAIAVLYLFVRRLRSTLVVGLAIPISVIASFFLMFVGGVSLNIMSLGGLALGIGMLVDSSIVVLESIERHRVAGADRGTASRTGGAEVGSAVVAATLTTLCVFIPVVFVSGIAGQLFVDPALTVTFSLLVSLAVALTLIPMASAVGAATEPPAAPEPQAPSGQPAPSGVAAESEGAGEAPAPAGAAEEVARELLSVRVAAAPGRGILAVVRGAGVVLRLLITPLVWLFENGYGGVSIVYPRVLGWALRRRLLVIVLAVVLLAGSLSLVPLLGSELIPEIRQGTIVADVELPPGTPVARTDVFLAEMQRLAAELPAVAQTYAVAGSSRTGDEEVRENSGQILIDLHPEYRRSAEDRALAQLRDALAGVPGAAVTFSRPPLLTFDAAVEARISGAAPAVVERAAQAVAERLAEVRGLADVSARLAGTSPEVVIDLNRGQLAELDLDAEAVGEIVAAKLQGEVPTELERGRQDVALRVRTRPEDRATIEDLAGLIVTTVGDVPVPLSAVAVVNVAEGANEIRRVDQRRVVLVVANLDGRDLGSVTEEVQAVLDDVAAEYRVDAELAGQWQDMVDSFDSMQLALILALILTYLVMAAPVRVAGASPDHPGGGAVRPGGSGADAGDFRRPGERHRPDRGDHDGRHGRHRVNNAIVLVDYVNQLRRRGLELQAAIRQAAVTRVRPILMTTATTVLGLVPLALRLGEGWELRQPLAVTVIGGLLFSTLITLVLVPTLYSLIGGHGVRRETAKAAADGAALEVSP